MIRINTVSFSFSALPGSFVSTSVFDENPSKNSLIHGVTAKPAKTANVLASVKHNVAFRADMLEEVCTLSNDGGPVEQRKRTNRHFHSCHSGFLCTVFIVLFHMMLMSFIASKNDAVEQENHSPPLASFVAFGTTRKHAICSSYSFPLLSVQHAGHDWSKERYLSSPLSDRFWWGDTISPSWPSPGNFRLCQALDLEIFWHP